MTNSLVEQTPGGIQSAISSLGIDGRALFGQIVNFIILLIILQRFVYRPLVGILEHRRQEIENAANRAKEIEERYSAFQIDHEKRLNESKVQATAMIDLAKAAGEELRGKTIEEAQLESERLIKRAHAEIGQEKDKMMAQLKEEIGALVVAAAAKILQKEIKEEDHLNLIKEAVGAVKE